MTGTLLPTVNVEEKLFQNRYRVDAGRAHIRTRDQAVCAACKVRPCIVCCPAGCWRPEEGEVDVVVDGCLECGTCRVVCASQNIDWDYPRGGFGVLFKFG